MMTSILAPFYVQPDEDKRDRQIYVLLHLTSRLTKKREDETAYDERTCSI